MKVLWICNVPNKDVYTQKGSPAGIGGGWLTGLSESLKNEKSLELVYCYPLKDQKEQDNFYIDGVHYYSFYSQSRYRLLKGLGVESPPVNKRLEIQDKQILKILENEEPDIVHVFGTEYFHSLSAVELAEEKSHIVCSIQGLTSIYEYHYLRLLPSEIYRKFNISSLFRGTLLGQKKDLKMRGEIEKRVLSKCNNVIGRTDWDKACTYYLNRNRKYYYCNETLRDNFYHTRWKLDGVKRHSLFMSQGSSPIKGLNILIEAMSYLKKDYPDIILRIGGNELVKKKSLKNRIKLSTYGEYIRKLINKYDLMDNILFVGPLNEEQMVLELIRSNVFVSSSSIENSSNSIGEAMLLGVPVVSSDVGGIKSLMKHNEEGIIYQADAPYMLAYNIMRLFDDDELCKRLSENGRNRALENYNPERNMRSLLAIYNEILKSSEYTN